MEIVKCKEEDLDTTAQFYDKVTAYLDRTVNYPQWTAGEYPGRESTRRSIEEGVQYICVDGEKTVGAFVLNDDPNGDYSRGDWHADLKEGEYLVIHTLATDPDMRNKGLARFMVEYCINVAKSMGYKAIRLDAVPTNVPARRLYESLGFLFAGEKDLLRGIEDIPTFVLYEYNLDNCET